jgi:hypothetical protein
MCSPRTRLKICPEMVPNPAQFAAMGLYKVFKGRQRVDIRDIFQQVIDALQFRFDIFPRLYYEPLPWLGLDSAKRGEGTTARRQAIEPLLTDYCIKSAMDVGCSVGYFCFTLGLKGIPALGVDMDARALRVAQYTSRKLKTSNVGFCNMVVNAETVRLLPNVDLALVLSIWHHWVRLYGLAAAGEILSAIWNKCSKVLVFETGETEMPAEFALPDMGASPREWLTNYLGSQCVGSKIGHLGVFKAFAPFGDENRNVVYRNLFAIVRTSET